MFNLSVLCAIFKRNFLAYFSNPTGYVFICGFVLATGYAAFWPHEFFNANLANLDQLNRYFPFIALFFIPAITMSIWAEERRQGTDELLLTIPASDFAVVLGKYLAAAAIFTVSLLFSLSNVFVLHQLGNPDTGLLVTGYLGYWMVGLTMLSIGMTASFLTSNLTVGFVLGVALNIPLVLAANSDMVITSDVFVSTLKEWSVSSKFQDFSRGVISLSSLVYFTTIIAAFTYLNMVLIGKRHWSSGGLGQFNALHYFVRVAAMIAIAVGLSWLAQTFDARVDASSEKLSSLHPKTVELLKQVQDKRAVHIEAFVSPEGDMPESYVQTRTNLLTMLDELKKRSNSRVTVNINDTESFKPEATIAQQRYGIEGRTVVARDRGKMKRSQIWLGVAVTSGLDKVVIPFFDRGIPAEYELVRSIVSLSDKDKKTIGVVSTDARLMGGFDQGSMRSIPKEPLIVELEKQYEVKEVDPSKPIDVSKFDVMLVVQPSSLSPQALPNVVAAVRDGAPTAIFEDPQPFFDRSVPGTSQPKQPPQSNPFMRRPPPQPKGDIKQLFDVLQVELVRAKHDANNDGVSEESDGIVWQAYNPYPKYDDFPNEFVFISRGAGQPRAFNPDDPITAGLQQTMLLCPGAWKITADADSSLTHTKLLLTGNTNAGLTPLDGLFMPSFMGQGGGFNPERPQLVAEDTAYTLALRITGEAPALKKDPHAGLDAPPLKREEDKQKKQQINVVLVSDIDLIGAPFFDIRSRGDDPDTEMDFHLDIDNITLALNVIDDLAGDERFIDIRKRRRVHRTLTAFEKVALKARADVKEARDKFVEDFKTTVKAEEDKINDRLQKIIRTPGMDQRQFQIQLDTARKQLEKAVTTKRAQLERTRDSEIQRKEADAELTIRQTQNKVKRLAVFIPPIIPLMLGLMVFFNRRATELEGAAKSRLR